MIIFMVTDSLEEAIAQKRCLVSIFNDLQVPLEPSKLEDPTMCLSFPEVNRLSSILFIQGGSLSGGCMQCRILAHTQITSYN